MSQAQYARHRGCSKVAVGKAVKANRISLVNGQIDATVADIQWRANTRARVSRSAASASGDSAHGATQPLGLGDPLPTSSAASADTPDDVGRGDGYTANRNLREAADRQMAELNLAKAQGSLISVDSVRAALGSVFSTTRDALLQIPARLSPLLAAESDPATVQTMLYTELHQALQHLAGATARIGQTESTAE